MAKKQAGEVLVVASKVKGYIRAKKMMCASDVIEGLSGKIRTLLDEAMARTKANKRSTLRPHDL